tara:strand:+ start:12512 stop:12703 length:192 start_codon:yes stop_codon:yes gene_type:complete
MPRMNGAGLVSSSQERIVDGVEEEMGVKSIAETVESAGERASERIKDGTISKTVEFQFHTTSA